MFFVFLVFISIYNSIQLQALAALPSGKDFSAVWAGNWLGSTDDVDVVERKETSFPHLEI
jgi:hypothetical protein